MSIHPTLVRGGLALALLLAVSPPAPAQSSRWSIVASEGACVGWYFGGQGSAPGAAEMHGFHWAPGHSLSWFIGDAADASTKETEPLPVRVVSAAGARMEGQAAHVILKDREMQLYDLELEDRKDVSTLVSGDVTYSYPSTEPGKTVSVVVPYAQQLPRIRQCLAQARAQVRQASQQVAPEAGAPQRGAPQRGAPQRGGGGGGGAAAEAQLIATGSGVFVNAQGHLLTNAHVVENCSMVGNSVIGAAKLVAVDAASDLALLQFSQRPRGFVSVRPTGVQLGQSVVVAGFPLSGVLDNGLNVTRGNISALAGPGGDRRFIQITAPTQPGNSGGPVLDANGQLAGIVQGIMPNEATGDKDLTPQGLNYAVAPFVVEAFLQENGVSYDKGKPGRETAASIAEKARRHTVQLECWG